MRCGGPLDGSTYVYRMPATRPGNTEQDTRGGRPFGGSMASDSVAYVNGDCSVLLGNAWNYTKGATSEWNPSFNEILNTFDGYSLRFM